MIPARISRFSVARCRFFKRAICYKSRSFGLCFRNLYLYCFRIRNCIFYIKNTRNNRGTQKAQQIGAVFTALIITGILKTLANLVFPFFDNYDLLPYSAIFVLPGVLIYAYAISNFKLFSLENAFDQFRLFPVTYKIALEHCIGSDYQFRSFSNPDRLVVI